MSNIESTKDCSAVVGACAQWMKEWDAWLTAFELSIPRDCDGRPVWEPPIFDYSKYIGEEHEKKRKAMLEYTGGDVARTTEIMDADTERRLLGEYSHSVWDNVRSSLDPEVRKFFKGLSNEVNRDLRVVEVEWAKVDGGLVYREDEGGTYTVQHWRPSDFGFVDDQKSDNPSTISHNTHEPSISPSAPGTCESNNIIATSFDQSTINHNRIPSSSSTDEAEELAWLDFLDASSSTTSPPSQNLVQPRDTTPLALRLLSLRSSELLDTDQTEGKHTVPALEDDID